MPRLDLALDRLEARAALEGAAFTADEGGAVVAEAVDGLLAALSGDDPSGRFLALDAGGAPAAPAAARPTRAARARAAGAYVAGAVAEGATLEGDGDGAALGRRRRRGRRAAAAAAAAGPPRSSTRRSRRTS